MSLARLEQIDRRRGEAHDLLAKVYGWFTEGHNTLDLQDARTYSDDDYLAKAPFGQSGSAIIRPRRGHHGRTATWSASSDRFGAKVSITWSCSTKRTCVQRYQYGRLNSGQKQVGTSQGPRVWRFESPSLSDSCSTSC